MRLSIFALLVGAWIVSAEDMRLFDPFAVEHIDGDALDVGTEAQILDPAGNAAMRHKAALPDINREPVNRLPADVKPKAGADTHHREQTKPKAKAEAPKHAAAAKHAKPKPEVKGGTKHAADPKAKAAHAAAKPKGKKPQAFGTDEGIDHPAMQQSTNQKKPAHLPGDAVRPVGGVDMSNQTLTAAAAPHFAMRDDASSCVATIYQTVTLAPATTTVTVTPTYTTTYTPTTTTTTSTTTSTTTTSTTTTST